MFKKDPCLTISNSPHSPHSIIQSLVNKESHLLDVGCNTGFLAKSLKKKNVTSDGIDINREALKIARKYCRNVFRRDLYLSKLSLGKKKYDYIVFADVLEHVPRPDLLLKDSRKYLKKNGTVLISMPNVARLEIRLQLLFGKFNYTYGGILSEDHLRHFTKESAIRMIEDAGFTVLKSIPTGLGHQLKILPTLTAFQFIYICVKNFEL
ncbi:MAG: class I SAM-dependent methyltransferase [Patescibacteria group bacterium]